MSVSSFTRTSASLLAFSIGLCTLPAVAQTESVGRIVPGILQKIGTVNVKTLAAVPKNKVTPEPRLFVRPFNRKPILAGDNQAQLTPIPALVSGLPQPNFALAKGNFFGFAGISERENNALIGGAVEPPDYALAVGNGYVVEAVNNSLAIYTTGGIQAVPTVATTTFLGLAPSVFLSDPRAYFDPDTQRWFVVEWAINSNTKSSTYIAVSQTADPTGTFDIYTIDSSDKSVKGCPCFPDYPQIGADKNGFYISSNRFGILTGAFTGANIYALSKLGLTQGTLPPVAQINPPLGNNGEGFAVHPALTPPGGSYETANGGTEYFASTLDPTGTSDNRMAVWALVNTSSLNTNIPNVTLKKTFVTTETYNFPKAVPQKPGSYPFGQSLGEPLPLMNGNLDDRVTQPVFTNGKLWVSLTTGLTSTTNGIAYFVFAPSTSGGTLSSTVAGQGYVSAGKNSVTYSAIGVNAKGQGAITFTLFGPDYFPSSAFIGLNKAKTVGPIQVSGVGQAPDDGFTAYPQYGGSGAGRWGDYSGAAVDSDGTIWLGTEYIPPLPRTEFANWGTYITQFKP